MKTRNGFVSNSSSSSFIVVFKKVPLSADSTFNEMFPSGNKEDKLDYYDHSMTCGEIAKVVFNDLLFYIKDDAKKKIKKDDVINLLAQRYHGLSSQFSDNVFFEGKETYETDRHDHKKFPYYATDEKLYQELVDIVMKAKREEEEDSKKRRAFFEKIPNAKYATKEMVEKGEAKEEDLKAYTNFIKKMTRIQNSKAYKAYQAEYYTAICQKYDDEALLARKLAEKDYVALMKDNKNFIAVLRYSDNDSSQGAFMEHGNIFRNILHIRISQH